MVFVLKKPKEKLNLFVWFTAVNWDFASELAGWLSQFVMLYRGLETKIPDVS